MAKYQIDIDDVIRSGSVEQAVIDEMPDDVLIADSSAMGGQTFTCSGPGPGWSKTFGANDYALAAIQSDASASGCDPSESSVIDPADGRIAHGVDGDEGGIEWEDESSVELIVPSLADVAASPTAFGQMWAKRASYSDNNLPEWESLADKIRLLFEIISD